MFKFFRRLRGHQSSAADGTADREAQRESIAAEFDENFYRARHPDVEGDALDHFSTVGWMEGYDPAPHFSTSAYLRAHPDVAEAGLNPFYHYLAHGRGEGRVAVPSDLGHVGWQLDAIRSGLDEDFYRTQLHERGLRAAGDLALHYWCNAVSLSLDPTADFSTRGYLDLHEDVARARINPFTHYLLQGKAEGRAVVPVAAKRPASHARDGDEVARSFFDPSFYLAANSDVAEAKVDPFKHFMECGWKEGRNPTPWFSVSHYCDSYPDVVAAKVNPFVHYLVAGKAEGRQPRHDLGFRYDIIRSLEPLDERIAEARKWVTTPKPEPASRLRAALGNAKRLESGGLFITASHDDFTLNFGGVQLVLLREAERIEAQGRDHLHLFPTSVISTVEMDDNDPVIGILLNRRRVGFFRSSDVAKELQLIQPRLRSQLFAVHSLIRHEAQSLISILRAARCRTGFYWVHDYSSICAGYNLLRNDVQFCGGPPPQSTACRLCVYGALRQAQMDAHEKLFAAFDLTVLAPSQTALDVWQASASVKAPSKVHEHVALTASKRAKPTATDRKRPLRIGFVGQAVSHKGWSAFRELVLEFRDDKRYEFHHLGKGTQSGVPAIHTEVSVGPDDLDRMIRVLKEREIDAVILWSLWPETFCIAAAEVLEAGGAIITHKDSGNVAAMVRKFGVGAVLDSENELCQLFEGDGVSELVARRRGVEISGRFSGMTADLVESHK